MLHDHYVDHDFVVKLIWILLSLHVLCWGLVYYLAFKHHLVCMKLDMECIFLRFNIPICSCRQLSVGIQRGLWLRF